MAARVRRLSAPLPSLAIDDDDAPIACHRRDQRYGPSVSKNAHFTSPYGQHGYMHYYTSDLWRIYGRA